MRAVAQVGEGNLERRAIKAEKIAMRAMLYPVMQAEEDRRRALHLPRQECCLPGKESSDGLVVCRPAHVCILSLCCFVQVNWQWTGSYNPLSGLELPRGFGELAFCGAAAGEQLTAACITCAEYLCLLISTSRRSVGGGSGLVFMLPALI